MNGPTHRWTAGGLTFFYLLNRENQAGRQTAWPFASGAAAAVLTNLPDWLEPAMHPNHRQFFHSVAFAGVLGVGLAKLHAWEPESPEGEFWRKLGMLAISAYLIHLALDATTRKSLPLLGRI